jgi:hypothetical protein
MSSPFFDSRSTQHDASQKIPAASALLPLQPFVQIRKKNRPRKKLVPGSPRAEFAMIALDSQFSKEDMNQAINAPTATA